MRLLDHDVVGTNIIILRDVIQDIRLCLDAKIIN